VTPHLNTHQFLFIYIYIAICVPSLIEIAPGVPELCSNIHTYIHLYIYIYIYIYISTPWPQFASELYRPSDRRLSAKLVPTFCGYRVPSGQRDESLRPYSWPSSRYSTLADLGHGFVNVWMNAKWEKLCIILNSLNLGCLHTVMCVWSGDEGLFRLRNITIPFNILKLLRVSVVRPSSGRNIFARITRLTTDPFFSETPSKKQPNIKPINGSVVSRVNRSQ
jgi:hypothetical protein